MIVDLKHSRHTLLFTHPEEKTKNFLCHQSSSSFKYHINFRSEQLHDWQYDWHNSRMDCRLINVVEDDDSSTQSQKIY